MSDGPRIVPFKSKELEEAQQNIIMFLEKALAKAKKGEYLAMGIAFVCRDNSFDRWQVYGNRATMLCGAVSMLHYKVLQGMQTTDIDEGEDEPRE